MKAIIDKFTIYLLLLMFSINASAQVQLGGNPEGVNLFALSPDGETLAGSNFPGTIHLWDTATGAEKDVFISEFTIGDGAVLTFSPDGTLLASGSERSRVTLWDVATGEVKFVLEHVVANTISSISFSPDGTTLASCAAGRWGTSSPFIYLWDVETGEKKSEIELPELPMSSTFSPDGTTLAIGTTGPGNKAVSVYLWDIHENVEIIKLEITKLQIVTPETWWRVQYVAFSPDGSTLAAGIRVNQQLVLILWDVISRRESGRLHGYSTVWNNTAFAFSPDGMILAGTGGDPDDTRVYGLYLWNIINKKDKNISETSRFAGVSLNGTFYAVEVKEEVIDGNNTNTYLLWTISPEDVFMDVVAHGKLATRWADLK